LIREWRTDIQCILIYHFYSNEKNIQIHTWISDISINTFIFQHIHRTYYLFFKLHEIINKHVLVYVCYYSFCNEILMIHVFFQRYKYFWKDILLFMSYLISLHMKKMFHFNFEFLLITLTSLKYFPFFYNIWHKIQVHHR
jgi:hypothetical protein